MSGTYRRDEELIKAFATEFDPQPFYLDGAVAQPLPGIGRERLAYSSSDDAPSRTGDSRWAMETVDWAKT